jgi:hypothetical protein
VTVKLTVPTEVGVPVRLMVPVPPPEIVSPVVLVTLESASVILPEPPEAVIDWLYASPITPAGSVLGLRTIAGITVNE